MVIENCIAMGVRYFSTQHNDINKYLYFSNKIASLFLGQRNDVIKFFKDKSTTNVDLSKLKKVYYDKGCEYPRAKLAQFTEIKRCLKPEKGDAIIMSYPKHFDQKIYEIYHSPSKNEYYVFTSYSLRAGSFSGYLQCAHGITNAGSIKDLSPYLKGFLGDDLVFHYSGDVIIGNDTFKETYNLLQTSVKPIIFTDELDRAIGDLMETPEVDTIESINEFLESTDSSTVDLGMKLLLNYNVQEHACTIGMMILKNGRRISNANSVTSVGFVNLLEILNLKRSDLLYFQENQTPRYLSNFYKISNNIEDKSNARNIIRRMVEESIKDYSRNFEKIINSSDLKVTISVQ